jgi:hypothetical protein
MKEGEQVIIYRAYRENIVSSWIDKMDVLIGKEVTIEELYDECFFPKECKNGYHYPIECIKPIEFQDNYEIY